MSTPWSARLEPDRVERVRRANAALIATSSVVGLVALALMAWSIADGMRIVTVALTGLLAVACLVQLLASVRRRTMLLGLVGRSTDGVALAIDDHGVTLAGAPSVPWSEVLFVGLLDDRERTARVLRIPVLGWFASWGIAAGNATLGGELGVRDGEAMRAACASDAERKRITVFGPFPDGARPGSIALLLDAVLPQETALEGMRVLSDQAAARGIPRGTFTRMTDYFGFKGPFLDPKWR